MRVLVALAAALALAGCQVNLEGAACSAPGSSAQCPSGQSCGLDQRCSSSPVMTCPARTGAEFVVDPGAPAGAPAPSGARTPAACRFRSLDQALAAAVAAGVSGAVIRAAGAATPTTPITYPVTATLAVPAGVTLRGDDDPPAPANRVLSLEGGLAAGVTLAEGATLSGLTVQNGSAPATAVGVEIACAGTAPARLTDVIVQAAGATAGAPALVNGVHAGGACPVVLTTVTVEGASGPGLLVARDAAADTLLATDAFFDGNGEGVHVTRGDVTLERPTVKGSAAGGVVAWPVDADGDALLTIHQGLIRSNGDTGVLVLGKQAGRLRLTNSRVCANGATTARGAPYAQRKVGGLYLFGNPPPDLAVETTALFSNAGDQLLVAGAGTWALDGAAPAATACGAGVNLLDGYAPADGGVTYVGLFAASATVSARWNAWRLNMPPQAGVDYAASGTGSVDAGTSASPAQFCTWVAAPPTCD